MTQRRVVDNYQYFGRTYFLYLHHVLKSDKWLLTFGCTMRLELHAVLKETVDSPEVLVTTCSLHCVITRTGF
jgi:hypothetical protein